MSGASEFTRRKRSAPAEPDRMLGEVGLRIQQLRENARLTPAAFAIKAGTTLPYLWRVETGRVNLNLRTISRIAVALGVPMTDILTGIEADVTATVGRGKGDEG